MIKSHNQTPISLYYTELSIEKLNCRCFTAHTKKISITTTEWFDFLFVKSQFNYSYSYLSRIFETYESHQHQ